METLSIVTPPGGHPLHLDDVKAQVRADGTSEDVLLSQQIAAAHRTVEAETGRSVLTQTRRIVLAGFPAALLHSGGSDRAHAGLPDDGRTPGYVAAVAAVDGLEPEVADVVRDARGRQFVIDQAARYGGIWRLALSPSVV